MNTALEVKTDMNEQQAKVISDNWPRLGNKIPSALYLQFSQPRTPGMT